MRCPSRQFIHAMQFQNLEMANFVYFIYMQYGYTPLHLAARSGNDQVVRLLLNSPGVRVDTSTAQNVSVYRHLFV